MVKIENISSEIQNILSDYSEDITATVDNELHKIGKEAVKELKNNGNIPTKSGDYKRKFYLTKKNGVYVIANRKHQLTHLLEKGHEKRGGGRTKAFPHWAEAEKNILHKADKLIKSLGG